MASGGVAFFTGLTVDQAGSGYTIQVTGINWTPRDDQPFNVIGRRRRAARDPDSAAGHRHGG